MPHGTQAERLQRLQATQIGELFTAAVQRKQAALL